jgi:transposase
VTKYIRIGVDLAKNYFHVHALESEGGRAASLKLKRAGMFKFFASLEPTLVGMEACGSAHYWARELMAMGHEVRLMPPSYVKAYVKRGKSDAIDADACCEAVSRPTMRFVPVKSAQQQATLMLHRTRESLTKQRTMNVNALRGHLSEFGLVAAKGIDHVGALVEEALGDAALPEAAKACVKLYCAQIAALDAALGAVDDEIARVHAQDERSRLLDEIPGVGPVIATAIAASAPDPSVFKSARDFSAWLGLTPRQDSTGGKVRLGPISKKGDRYLRKLLVIGATSLIRVAGKHKGALAEWIVKLRAGKSARFVAVALANKLARIVWAMLTSGEAFRKQDFARA